MAKKISQLTQATEVKSDDVTVIVQDGETKKLPLNMMVTKQDIENKKVAGLAKLDEIEATYENDTYTPTITVKNKSSVKTGEGDEVDYSANVMDGHAKSAILKGQTLVNLAQSTNPTNLNGEYVFRDNFEILNFGCNMIKPSTTYTIISNIIENSANFLNLEWNTILDECAFKEIIRTDGSLGIRKFKVTSKDDLSNVSNSIRFFPNNKQENGTLTITFMLLEGDYTKVDIPYFEGMQSVKMPVLTTVGKNLFDGLSYIDGFVSGNTVSYDNNVTSILVNVNKNTDYILSAKTNFDRSIVGGSLEPISTGNKITNLNARRISNTITFNSGEYTNIIIYLNSSKIDIEDIQVEEGTVATTYEPYKSNILTVNEDVTLRGIGNVKDELDCLTGEVTERIGNLQPMQLTFGSPLSINTNTVAYSFEIIPDIKPNQKNTILSNALPQNNATTILSENEGFYTDSKSTLVLVINKSRLTTLDKNGLLKWLTDTSCEIIYLKSSESIKTVDLIPSGTHPSTTPYCWKDGHIQLSSSGLLPSLEYSVVTSRAGQINQNAAMIVKNDKRIFDLEILLAGGLVNTTYQALTLQNQVETGLSKVSLNSETEPDYLLYHMIMKLIEEKAYKLDDLTEKVSVFYLYEKLSDEQFETIYSALYPFVEDEIIEEPVVEELPEVVEDEVIM